MPDSTVRQEALGMMRRYRQTLWKQAAMLSAQARDVAGQDGASAEIRWQDAKALRAKARLLTEVIKAEERQARWKADALAAVARYEANHGITDENRVVRLRRGNSGILAGSPAGQ